MKKEDLAIEVDRFVTLADKAYPEGKFEFTAEEAAKILHTSRNRLFKMGIRFPATATEIVRAVVNW